MSVFLHRWLRICLLNLLLVSILGLILRYKIAFYLPLVDQKYLLHSHSHFAFSGWITQALMVLLVQYLSNQHGEWILRKYRWLLYANLLTAYGMLVSFVLQGYAFYSISFSTLSIVVSYIFAIFCWRDLNLSKNKVSSWWIKAGLVFSVLSSIGAFGLAYMMANKIVSQDLYFGAIYFFLHFQYNGWFLFAGLGLLTTLLEKIPGSYRVLKAVFLLFCLACVPAYLLSVLWLKPGVVVSGILLVVVLAQLFGWILLLNLAIKNKHFLQEHFSKFGRILLLLAAIAFSIKLILQAGSVHPALSQLAYGFRPIIIGYLHLVLLAVTSLFLLGYIVALRMIALSTLLTTGLLIFVAGVIINELLLMAQGLAAFTYTSLPHITHFLLGAAFVLVTGCAIMFIAASKQVAANSHSPLPAAN